MKARAKELTSSPAGYVNMDLYYLCNECKVLLAGPYILAHRERISEILPWDRKSYLTEAILPRLSRKIYIHWLYWNSPTLSSSDVIVMLK